MFNSKRHSAAADSPEVVPEVEEKQATTSVASNFAGYFLPKQDDSRGSTAGSPVVDEKQNLAGASRGPIARICGISRRVFWICLAVAVVCLGIGIGGGVGIGVSIGNKNGRSTV
jgi:hypothetical protein